MKRALLVVSLLLFAVSSHAQNAQTLSGGVEKLAAQFKQGMAEKNRKRVGITAFTDVHSSARTMFGSYLAEAITTRLVMAGFDVVERPQMDKVIAMLKHEETRAIDQATAKKLGHQAGVEAIVIGSLTDLGYAIEVNARMIDIATGSILAAANVQITRDTMVTALAGPGPGKKPEVEEDKPRPKPPVQEEEGAMAWREGGTRIVIDGGYRNYKTIVLALAFENASDEERTIRAKAYYLVDENGDRYRFDHDSEKFVTQGVAIAPKMRARSNFYFGCNGACNGTKFTLLDANNKVILRNIPVARD